MLVYSKDILSHVTHLREVLTLLRKHNFYLKLSKCIFAQQQLRYLSHIVSAEGVATDPSKTDDMLTWPTPTNTTELRGFLGLTGYYRKFVPHHGILSKPLTTLLKKKQFSWTTSAQEAFVTLKEAMTKTPVLALPDFSQPFELETDACDTGIGAVLLQHSTNTSLSMKKRF
jgi:hypothetical protein